MASTRLFCSPRRSLVLLLLSLLFLVFATLGLALPQDGQPFPEYDTVWPHKEHLGKVPNLDDCRKSITAPPRDSSLFFTGLRSNSEINIAKGYAEAHGLTHVSRAYPVGFTNLLAYEDSPEALAQFQRDYMQVFAEESSGRAFLMIPDGSEPRTDSIFSTVELPAVIHANQVDVIVRLSFGSPPDDPNTSQLAYWGKPSDADDFASGRCTVHFWHYMIPEGGIAYSLEAIVRDDLGNEVGHQEKIDATEPVRVFSKLPYPLVITIAKPGYKYRPDRAMIQFHYGHLTWTSDEAQCAIGKVWHGDREGDCSWVC